jgi:hypothetical protein
VSQTISTGARTEMAGFPIKGALLTALVLCLSITAVGQTSRESDYEFGPVVTAYLGYLKNEQEVVDDRVSRREISASYYRRNSSRIRALRQIAIKLARESHNDYLPELEAVAVDEMGLLFEHPPAPNSLKVGAVIRNTFRYMGSVRSGEVFYIFARLDPYEQADLKAKSPESPKNGAGPPPANGSSSVTRSRRVGP